MQLFNQGIVNRQVAKRRVSAIKAASRQTVSLTARSTEVPGAVGTSTPPQPAYAILERLVTVNATQCRSLPELKLHDIKALALKLLKFIVYSNRFGLGS